MIGWGDVAPALTEVMSDGTKAFELDIAGQVSTYRAFRFPWQGNPAYPPSLIVETESPTLTLRYSWNGATEVVSYHVRGGQTPYTATTLIDTQVMAGFETTTTITDTGVIGDACYLWVTAVDGAGDEMGHSNAVFVGDVDCLTDKVYLPLASSIRHNLTKWRLPVVKTAPNGQRNSLLSCPEQIWELDLTNKSGLIDEICPELWRNSLLRSSKWP